MATIPIPRRNWHLVLAETLKTARPGDTIVVHSTAVKELAEIAMVRMKRNDLTVIVGATPEEE